ncbi:MAG TPA: tyrosine-type recombinase/integrase [Planctomycetota bacterium]|nr:tyrosine-type recombinase/integrase [Planctomycetota bacterium]
MPARRWVLDESKFLSTREVKKLLRAAKARARRTTAPAGAVAVRDHMVVDLALSTGLRVGELARLACGDVFVRDGKASLTVRRGKGGKPRWVWFNGASKNLLLRYLQWKKEHGEPANDEAPLFLSVRTGTFMTTRALEKAFKRAAAAAGLSAHYSIHSLRHTYACHLYRASGWNLRLVQKQLGHSSIATTQVYADVMEPDVRRALEKLYA